MLEITTKANFFFFWPVPIDRPHMAGPDAVLRRALQTSVDCDNRALQSNPWFFFSGYVLASSVSSEVRSVSVSVTDEEFDFVRRQLIDENRVRTSPSRSDTRVNR
jgi:hypothetical protein